MKMRNFIDIITEREIEETPLQRAKEQGFTTHAFHGTASDFDVFDMEKGRAGVFGYAPFFASIKGEAKGYAKKVKGGKVLEFLLRIKKPLYLSDNGMGDMTLEQFKIVSNGVSPPDSEQMNFHDATNIIGSKNYKETGSWGHQDLFKGVYERLRAAGYDSIIFADTWPDHQSKKYDKIQMLDMSAIRLVTAEFDPALQNVAGLRN